MGVDLRTVKKQFAELVDHIQPVAVSQFVIWLDEKVSEFKVHGHMRLGLLNDELDAPTWIRKYAMNMLTSGLIPTIDKSNSCVSPSHPASQSISPAAGKSVVNSQSTSTNRRFSRPSKSSLAHQTDVCYIDDDAKKRKVDPSIPPSTEMIAKRPAVNLLNSARTPIRRKENHSIHSVNTNLEGKLNVSIAPGSTSLGPAKLENTGNFDHDPDNEEPDIAHNARSVIKNEPLDVTSDEHNLTSHTLGAFIAGDAPYFAKNNENLEMTNVGAMYVYPTSDQNFEDGNYSGSQSDFPQMETNDSRIFMENSNQSFDNSKIDTEISLNSNLPNYEDGFDASYDDPAEYMETINKSESSKNSDPQVGPSTDSGSAVKQRWRRVNRRFPMVVQTSDDLGDSVDFTTISSRSPKLSTRGSVRKNLFNKVRYGELLDNKIVDWIKSKQSQNVHVKTADIKKYALFVAQDVAPGFKASNGWLHKFKRRHNLYRDFSLDSSSDTFLDLSCIVTDDVSESLARPSQSIPGPSHESKLGPSNEACTSNILERLLNQPVGN